jgi:transcriptional regulator with GAF, ATPase, and Fis domain
MDFESLQAVALLVAQERSVATVLQRIVEGLAGQRGIAMARVWLVAPGDQCSTCPMRAECPDQTRCLHLAASAGRSSAAPAEDWTRLDGQFRRFPLGVRKIGRIGASGVGLLAQDLRHDSGWIVRPEWARREGIRSFAGQPLVFRGEALGVLAVFSRAVLDEAAYARLRSFADQAAVALANSRAFAEIERLRQRLEQENAYLREEVHQELGFGGIVGNSPALHHVLQQIEAVAPTGASVLLLGESGTGKELFARAIHEHSARKNRPLIKVNCAAVPRELFESEFFGHVRGAFSGALQDRLGRFQLADGGTLLLDEVGEIPLELQSKLLRVLQEGQFERVGQDKTRSVDVRVLAATNRALLAEVEAGRFRRDLYYRLGVFPIEIPPLRERREDIALLASHFLELAARRLGRPAPAWSAEDLWRLQRYPWPGNVRELQHVVERALILGRGGPPVLSLALEASVQEPGPSSAPAPGPIVPASEWKAREKANLVAALNQAGGKVYGPGGAAELLGMKPTTLASQLKALGIRAKRP